MGNEIWKDVKGFKGLYQISSYGRIKSFKKDKNGLILKCTNKTGWYFSVVLCGKNKKSKSIKIHRLVAEYFIKNPSNLPQVNHKDLNKQNNNVSNLEWVTSKENIKHSVLNNPSVMDGFNKYNQIIKTNKIIQKSLSGEIIEIFTNGSDASKKTGVCQRNILQVANKIEFSKGHFRKQAGGFIWELGGKNV